MGFAFAVKNPPAFRARWANRVMVSPTKGMGRSDEGLELEIAAAIEHRSDPGRPDAHALSELFPLDTLLLHQFEDLLNKHQPLKLGFRYGIERELGNEFLQLGRLIGFLDVNFRRSHVLQLFAVVRRFFEIPGGFEFSRFSKYLSDSICWLIPSVTTRFILPR